MYINVTIVITQPLKGNKFSDDISYHHSHQYIVLLVITFTLARIFNQKNLFLL